MCDLSVRVPDGTYMAEVEIDLGPYRGAVKGRKELKIGN
jgi:hypothetical protein